MIPLHFRLNFGHTEAGLITNCCKNRSKSPLERRTRVEEETGEIYFNPSNLKSNLHANRFSSLILS